MSATATAKLQQPHKRFYTEVRAYLDRFLCSIYIHIRLYIGVYCYRKIPPYRQYTNYKLIHAQMWRWRPRIKVMSVKLGTDIRCTDEDEDMDDKVFNSCLPRWSIIGGAVTHVSISSIHWTPIKTFSMDSPTRYVCTLPSSVPTWRAHQPSLLVPCVLVLASMTVRRRSE